MIYIFHGNDNVTARKSFSDQKDSESITYDASSIELAELEASLQGGGMFGGDKKVFIENLFSRKGQKLFDSVVEILNRYSKTSDIYLYADKEIGKRELSVFKNMNDQNFKIPQTMWNFLDGLRPNDSRNVTLFRQTLSSNEPEVVFAMLVRQFRILTSLSDWSSQNIDEANRLAPWQKGKFERQLSLFGQDKVKNIYKKLYKIEKQQKTGASNLSLTQAIDILLLQI